MNRVALIVGGASGIGAAGAEQLAAVGLTVAVADLDAGKAGIVAARLAGDGHRGFAVDVADEAAITALFTRVEDDLGAVAVLVVAAGTPGMVDGKRPTLKETTVANWDKVMAINARGSFICVREMLRRRSTAPVPDGRIILISSMAAQNSAANSPAAYASSKGAVLALTKVAAGEAIAHGVTVNTVAPGAIDTPMLRGVMPAERDEAYFSRSVAERVGRPDEIAAAIAFLASPGASYLNGACIDVNGGLLMR